MIIIERILSFYNQKERERAREEIAYKEYSIQYGTIIK